MTRRKSDWTMVYTDYVGGKQNHYVRFVPNMIALEELGFPHGVALATEPFQTKKQAGDFADRFDGLMNQILLTMMEEQ